jgi:RNA methyltransferase, TrmH family
MTSSTAIDSPHNAHVAAARSLLTRKGRAAASAFLVEGPHAVSSALESAGYQVREVFITEASAARETELVRAAARGNVVVRLVTDRVLAVLRDTVTPQGVVAVVDIPEADLRGVFAARPRLAVMLDQVSDPGNAGTVIRTADAAGAGAVVVSSGSVDVWSGKAVRSTAGSTFHVPIVAGVSATAGVAAARSAGLQVLSTAADGDVSLDELIDAGALEVPTMWVFGNEAHGLTPEMKDLATTTVRLPIYGGAESLNLAAAAAICLYASAREQRRTGT